MTDELDALKAALRQAPPGDPAAKAAAMRLAMENFDRLQGSAEPMRSTNNRPERVGIFSGVRSMFQTLSGRFILTATTSVAALAFGLFIVLPVAQNPGALAPKIATPLEEASKPKAPTDPVAALKDVAPLGASDVPMATPAAPVLPEVAALPPAPSLATEATGGAIASVDTEEGLAVEADAAMDAAPTVARKRMEAPAASAPMGIIAPAPGELGQSYEDKALVADNTEAFANAAANPVKVTAEEPVSTFSIDVDTASYAVVRSSLNAGFLPDPASVRVEEMINYFPYAYAAPEKAKAFRPSISVMPTPWNPGTRLVRIGLQGALPDGATRPALNLVFLIDTSGSMEEPNKLPLLKQSLALMLGQLHANDQVAIVAYAGSAGEVLPPTKASDKDRILNALDHLDAGGSTAGAEGLELAYKVAEGMTEKGEVSRVLLATDGDFNVGIDDPDALKTYIAAKRETGVYLSVLGFGRGNLDDATMQALAQNGNGTASYIDTLNEARKVLVDQLTGALYPIADNVKIQVEWNPAEVAEYRLIGYETRALAREDFNNDKVDAGDIGAGTQVTALYEVTAPDSPALRNDPLRYGKVAASEKGELGYLRLRSVAPGETASTLQETPILAGGEVDDDARFAAAIAGFGQLLTGGKYLGDWGWDQAIELARSGRGSDDFGYRIEAVNLMRMAAALSAK